MPTPRRALLPLLALAAMAAVACSSPLTDRLSYAEVQALNPGISADWILAEYPSGRVTRGPGGKVQRIEYGVTDPRGSAETLVLEFDEWEILRSKRYSGRVVRPARGDP